MRAPGESRAPFCFPLSGMFFTLGEWGVLDVAEVQATPATLCGAALYNVSNALGAAALAHALGFPDDVIRAGLTVLGASPESSPG